MTKNSKAADSFLQKAGIRDFYSNGAETIIAVHKRLKEEAAVLNRLIGQMCFYGSVRGNLPAVKISDIEDGLFDVELISRNSSEQALTFFCCANEDSVKVALKDPELKYPEDANGNCSKWIKLQDSPDQGLTVADKAAALMGKHVAKYLRQDPQYKFESAAPAVV